MKVTFQFEAQLRAVAGVGSRDVQVPEGTSLLAAMQQVSDEAGDVVRDRLLTTQRTVQLSLLVFVNEQPVTSAAAESCLLQSGDTILLLSPISGG